MDMAFSFDARSVQPLSGYEPLPEDTYKAVISGFEPKPTKAGTGGFIELKLMVIDGPQAQRTIFDRLNIWNNNEKAVEIAKRQLSAYCHVIGFYNFTSLNDFTNLLNKPFYVKVGVTKNDKGEINGNEVKALKDINGNEPGKQGAKAPAAQSAPAGFGAPQAQPVAQPVAQQWGQPQPAPQMQTAPAANPPWGAQPQQAPASVPPWAQK